eukprot:TRINITY_DN6367_c0_g1_i3.p4 TRINITY_DN6367_c0_g1~~TRINITY_DN6367_c0_g1_i3.p4  ORF type:complete len:185 (-),score=74.55 TRINITY_DN6367_c0_g1_i3:879-1433(-)
MKLFTALLVCCVAAAAAAMDYDELDEAVRRAVHDRDMEGAHAAIERYTEAFRERHTRVQEETLSTLEERHGEMARRWAEAEPSLDMDPQWQGALEERRRALMEGFEGRAGMGEMMKRMVEQDMPSHREMLRAAMGASDEDFVLGEDDWKLPEVDGVADAAGGGHRGVGGVGGVWWGGGVCEHNE